jgi:hypothetical protein
MVGTAGRTHVSEAAGESHGEVQVALPKPPFPPLQVTADTRDMQECPEDVLIFNTLILGKFAKVGGNALFTLRVKEVRHSRSLAGVKGHQWQGVVGG